MTLDNTFFNGLADLQTGFDHSLCKSGSYSTHSDALAPKVQELTLFRVVERYNFVTV